MALTPEQRKVLATIKTVAARKGASPKEVKAAIETGLVESNLTNPSGGDADSAGFRQERTSIYGRAHATSVAQSAADFFDETAKVKGRYGRAGDLAAAVQRPAAQYRGRYQQQSARADQLRGGSGGSGGQGSAGGSSRTTTTSTAGVDRSSERSALIAQFLQDKQADPVSFALQARQLKDVAPTTTTRTTRSPAATGSEPTKSGATSGRGKLLELFWQGANGVDAKNGVKVPQGFVSGHTDHVHVAAGPKQIIELGKLAQSLGLHVGENPYFTGQDPAPGVHVGTSNHYKIKIVNGKKVGEAIDVSSADPKLMAHYAALVAHRYGIKVHG